jgi:transposase InsO family protein
VIFRFIEGHHEQWPVRLLWGALDVSPAGYYAWQQRPASSRQQRQGALVVEIRAIHAEVLARYGSPRVHAELVARGQDCWVNTVAKLMHDHAIRAKTAREYRCTTDSDHDLPVADNLLDRRFDPESPNEVWVADITYIPTREGWLYLAAVEDLYARRVECWSMADKLETFFISFKKEVDHGADFATRAEARAAIVEYIEVFYNNQLRHSWLGYVSPAEHERQNR